MKPKKNQPKRPSLSPTPDEAYAMLESNGYSMAIGSSEIDYEGLVRDISGIHSSGEMLILYFENSSYADAAYEKMESPLQILRLHHRKARKHGLCRKRHRNRGGSRTLEFRHPSINKLIEHNDKSITAESQRLPAVFLSYVLFLRSEYQRFQRARLERY